MTNPVSRFQPNPSPMIGPDGDARHIDHLEPKKMIEGEQEYSPKELVEVISRSEQLSEAYDKSAGVGEGYTVREHTLMVLDVFTKELKTNPHTQQVLEKAHLSNDAFAFFLALHDIGKGVAIEHRGPSKYWELNTTLWYVQQYAETLGIEPYLPVFKALLDSDLVGEFLKKKEVGEKDCEQFVDELTRIAYPVKLSGETLLDLFVLFHQCDASSYPYVRERFFTTTSQEVNLGSDVRVSALNGEGDLVYSQSNRDKMESLRGCLKKRTVYHGEQRESEVKEFNLDDPKKISLEDLQKLIKIRGGWKRQMNLAGINKNEDVHYQSFRHRFKPVLDYKMPSRLVRALKHKGHLRTTCSYQLFDFRLRESFQLSRRVSEKEYRSKILPRMMRKTRRDEARISLLEQITVIHGTNSAALAVMILSDNLKLQCTGDLMRDGIAPMSGELQEGFDPWGVNQRSISAMTVADHETSIRYTQTSYRYDHEFNLSRFKNPNLEQILNEKKWDQTAVHLLRMRQWDEPSFRRLIDTEKYLSCLEEKKALAIKPLKTLLEVLKMKFTEAEKKFIRNVRGLDEGHPIPERLRPLFSTIKEAQQVLSYLNYSQAHSFDTSLYQARNGSRTDLWKVTCTVINLAMDQSDHSEIERKITQEVEKIEERYGFLSNVLTDEKPKLAIPQEKKFMRKMIENPIPVLFASTSYVPKEHPTHNEFVVTEPVKLGERGFDLIFTDTQESQKAIVEMLPEPLSQEMKVLIMDEYFTNLPFPLYHNVNQVRYA